MNIYRISQNVNVDYDTYDSAIVVAKDEDEARKIHPDGLVYSYNPITHLYDLPWWKNEEYKNRTWCWKLEDVEVELVGITDLYDNGEILCASFNAG